MASVGVTSAGENRPTSATKQQLRRRRTVNAIAPSLLAAKLSSQNDAPKAGDSSADGDYVMLREIRQKRSTDNQQRHQYLDTIIDEIKREKTGSGEPNSNHIEAESNTIFAHAQLPESKRETLSKDIVDKWRSHLFLIVEKDRASDMSTAISEARNEGIEISEIIEEQTGMNLLHKAILIGAHNAAMFMLEQASKDVLLQTYQVLVKGSPTVRHTLHVIAEKGSVKLGDIFIKRVGENLGKLMMLQEMAMEISGQRPRTFPCLHLAAFVGNAELTGFFIDKGTPINHLNSKNDTALLWAARWGHLNVMKLLISKGANPNLENDKGSTALYWAVRYNLPDAVQILLKEGCAKIDQERKLGFVAPIILASALGYEQIVNILLKAGADVNLEIRGGETALHQAAREGHTKVAEILINNGARVNEQDERGNTPLTLAAKFNNSDIVDMLISNGAIVTHKNHDGEGVWHLSLSNADNTSLAVLVRAMLRARTSGNTIQFYTNRPPLCVASLLGVIDKINFLLDVGLSLSDTDNLGNNIFHYAATTNNYNVITQFKSRLSLDCQNLHGDTALHVACSHGYVDTIDILLQNKVKADVKNNKGETALHVLARSTNTTTDSVVKLVDYMIKTHSWDSLHTQDNDGNNALHLASMFASTGVLWELRIVSTKATNNEGCTPFHTAVIEGKPEVLHTMLDIYEVVKRDANLNSRNNSLETVLQLASLVGDTVSMSRLVLYGADLSAQDIKQDTLLHKLATIMQATNNEKRYDDVIDTIFADLVRWWCLRHETMYPDDDIVLYRDLKRKALRFLISGLKNQYGLTVINHAAKLGCKAMLDKILMVPHVNYFRFNDRVRLDISHLTPMTNTTFDGNTQTVSCIEMLANMEDLYKAGRTLDVPPLKQVEVMYANVCAWTYAFLMFFHLLYMATYSWLSLHLVRELRKGLDNTSSFYSAQTALYVIVPIEPGMMILAGLVFTAKFVVRSLLGKSGLRARVSYETSLAVVILRRFRDNTTVAAGIVWSIFTIAWLILYYMRYDRHLYFLAVSLWFGWLYSISFTRGFKAVHYFWRMLKVMVIRDVFKFLIVYCFVLLAFAFAMHSLFQVSNTTAHEYESVFDTLFMTFNLMLGMVWLFEDELENHVVAAGHNPTTIKLFVILYLILSTVVLLNVLIAMMNDSYQTIKNTQTIMWRVDSVKLGLTVEHYLPWSTQIFTSVRIKRGIIDQSSDGSIPSQDGDLRWYIDVSSDSLEKHELGNNDDVAQRVKFLANQVDRAEKWLADAIKNITEEISELKTMMQNEKRGNTETTHI